eukprot:UN25685
MFEFYLSSLRCDKNCDCFQWNFQGIFSKILEFVVFDYRKVFPHGIISEVM